MPLLEVVVTCVFALQGILAAEWSYSGPHGPSHWKEITPTCGETSQSPINIFEGDVRADPRYGNIEFHNYDTSNGVTMTLKNNGHSALVALGGGTVIAVSGGGLPRATFRAVQFHFHWGSSQAAGSEHLINKNAYPMELHIVHYNTNYSDVSVAISRDDGLAVIGFMYEVSNADNPNYNGIVNGLTQIRYPDNSTVIPTVPLNSLLPATFANFYRYSGSLTTPSCQESVTWTVYKEPIKISENQLAKFRSLLDSHNHELVDNYRPVQDLNARPITANFDPDIKWGYYQGDAIADHWSNYYSNCGADHQSPVNIPVYSSQANKSIAGLRFINYNTQAASFVLQNDGYAAEIEIRAGDISISEGDLPGTFQAAEIHFHWGSTDMKGSEHTVDDHAYPMEAHVVHFRKSLNTLSKAVTVTDGLAVIGVFFEISPNDNPALKPITDNLAAIQNPGTSVTLSAFTLNALLPSDTESYFRYSGSLTTPKCYETVIWTVFKDTVKISASQLAAFRSLKSSEKDASGRNTILVDNFRPVQNLNDRIVFRSFEVAPAPKPHWSYAGEHGPDHWDQEFSTCDDNPKSRQSPINIQPRKVQFTKFAPLSFSNYSSANGVTMQIRNNGHTVQIDITKGNIYITGGGLQGIYKALQFHFHWGSDNEHGSEHLIDDKAYPMELHLVHYNTKYKDLGTAVTQPDGLAVLGFMYEVTKESNPAYESIISKLDDVKKPDTKANIDAMPLTNLLPENLVDFYRYQGSLTTPGCYESVTWTVFRDTIKLSHEQLDKFRSLLSSDVDSRTNQNIPLVDNYRRPQNINNRVVQGNFIIGQSSDAKSYMLFSPLPYLFTCCLVIWKIFAYDRL